MQRNTWLQRAGLPRTFMIFGATAFLIGSVGVGAKAEEYLLQAGDVIEMSVAGMPEMNARSAVQIDGGLSLPAVGDIKAVGRPISEIRDHIRTAVSSKLLLMNLPDGSQVTRAVDYDQVSASVVEYRPVFIGGDVAQPGERPFRPGMTVRQVIAASGGINTAVPVAPGYNVSQVRADYAVAWNAAVSASTRIWRLQKELGQDVPFDRGAWPSAPGQDGALERFLSVESEIYETQAKDHLREKAFLTEQLKQMESQTTVMQHQLEAEKSVEKMDADALADATVSFEKRRLTISSLQGFRSAALFSSTRRLQTQVNLMQLERQRIEVLRESERLAEENRLDLLDQLQKAKVVEGQQRAQLLAADEKLRLMGVAPMIPLDDADVPQIKVFRGGATTPETLAFDSMIEPGDVIEVDGQAHASPFAASVTPDVNPQISAAVVVQ